MNSSEKFISYLSVSYFIYDTIAGIVFIEEKGIYRWHHVFTLLVLGIPLIFDRWGCQSVLGLFVFEISGPCLCLRRILPWTSDDRVNLINDSIFMALFVVGRTVL